MPRSDLRTEPLDLPRVDRAVAFANFRRQRAEPTQYFAVGDPEDIATIVNNSHPTISEADLVAEAYEELALSDDMIDALGVEAFQVNHDVFEISYIYRRRHDLDLPARSLEFLWRTSRLLGANFWYLAQLDSALEVGFLIPYIPALSFLGSGQNDVVEDFYRSVDPEYQFATIQVPLDTDFLLEILEDRNMFSNGRRAEEISTLREIRRAEGVTHWVICDTDRDHIGALQIQLLPWPRGTVSEGFQTLRYPGMAEVRMQRMSYGWDTDEDASSLKDFVQERIGASAALMERRWVRSERRLHALTGHPAIDESDEDTDDDDEDSEDLQSRISAANGEEHHNNLDGLTLAEVSKEPLTSAPTKQKRTSPICMSFSNLQQNHNPRKNNRVEMQPTNWTTTVLTKLMTIQTRTRTKANIQTRTK